MNGSCVGKNHQKWTVSRKRAFMKKETTSKKHILSKFTKILANKCDGSDWSFRQNDVSCIQAVPSISTIKSVVLWNAEWMWMLRTESLPLEWFFYSSNSSENFLYENAIGYSANSRRKVHGKTTRGGQRTCVLNLSFSIPIVLFCSLCYSERQSSLSYIHAFP